MTTLKSLRFCVLLFWIVAIINLSFNHVNHFPYPPMLRFFEWQSLVAPYHFILILSIVTFAFMLIASLGIVAGRSSTKLTLSIAALAYFLCLFTNPIISSPFAALFSAIDTFLVGIMCALVFTAKGEKAFSASGKGKQNGARKVYVGNVSVNMSEHQLAKLFADFGAIARVNIPRDKRTGRGRGFGFVEFRHPDNAKKALSMNGYDMGGKNLKVSLAAHRRNNQQSHQRRRQQQQRRR